MSNIDKEWLERNIGKVVGTGLGVFLGFIYLISGFWKTLIFTFIVVLGFMIGYQVDRKENLKEWIDDLFMDRWMRK